MRFRLGLFAAIALARALASDPAAAQAAKPPASPKGSNSQFMLHREEAGGADGQQARARARAGDCAGALGSFDAAIRHAIDPSLRRDRGLCHEKLQHPYPAIEDYRAYLAERPDAPDAEGIRQRLAALEGTAASANVETAENPELASGEAELAIGGTSTAAGNKEKSSKKRETLLGPKEGDKVHSYDYYAEQEKKADAAANSPLRSGQGIIVGAFGNMPRVFFGGDTLDSEIGYAFGGTLRYSANAMVTVLGEFAYAGLGTSGAVSSLNGPLLAGGVELRFPVSRWADNHILLRALAGYERLTTEGSRLGIDVFAPRVAAGFRHVFGTSLGLEVLADGGPSFWFASGDSRTFGVFGASLGLVVGF